MSGAWVCTPRIKGEWCTDVHAKDKGYSPPILGNDSVVHGMNVHSKDFNQIDQYGKLNELLNE